MEEITFDDLVEAGELHLDRKEYNDAISILDSATEVRIYRSHFKLTRQGR